MFMAYIKSAYRHSIGNESYQNPDYEAGLQNVRLLKSTDAALMPEDITGSNARQTYRTAQICQMEVED